MKIYRIKIKLKNIVVEDSVIKYIKKFLGKCIRIAYKILYRLIPCDNKTVLFISFHGRGYSDNPKAIHEYMIQQAKFRDYKFIWAIKKNKGVTIEGAKVIKYFSIPYFYYLARSKYWICNCKLPKYVLKKKSQIYLQTWHGTPLKRLAQDIIVPEGTTFYRSGMSAEEMHGTYDDDVAKYNYMISPNRFCTEVFQSAFQIEKERLIETGYPRNDFIVNATEKDILEIKKRLNLPLDKKVILYAPTWRDNTFNMSGYTFELQVDFYKWKELLGEEYVVLFKPHYLIVNKFENDKALNGFLYNIDANVDIKDLYVISDKMVTDYSSVFFDYAILNRPIYFYMYDLVEYKEELRGFYLDIHKDLPGPIFENEEELVQELKNENCEFQLQKFNERFNHMEDGQASKRVVDIVFGEK